MKNLLSKIFTTVLCFGLFINSSAQTKIIASLDFDPKIDGFGFKNYKNDKRNWKDDITADDLIRMFGVKAACLSGDSAKNCVLKPSARTWIEYNLEAMNIGHCEGIGVASLRFNSALAFKKRVSPFQFQAGAKSPFSLRLDQTLENYIAYYWLTQTFDEIILPTRETAERGPVEIAKRLIASMIDRKDTYLLGLKKYDKGRIYDGHAITPFAVEEDGNQYKIHVYDNNYPGETRFLFINKTGTQRWTYSSAAKPTAKPDYVGDTTTKTLDLTATSWREGRCFDSTFANDDNDAVGCGVENALLNRPLFTAISFQTASDEDGEDAEFFLTGEGDMLVTDGDNGKRIGYDPKTGHFYEEIEDGIAELSIGGLGLDLPHFTVPYKETGHPYTIVFSGRNLRHESNLDFVFVAPGFAVGFDGIRLDPDETLTATISPDGEQITFTASIDGETPKVFYAFDADDENASYITTIGGVELKANKTLTYDFDFENGKLFFSDDDGNEDNYHIDLIRINADGSEQKYKQGNLDIGKVDKYEMDFGKWDGAHSMCFKDDEDSDGFDDEKCSEQPNEDEGRDENETSSLLESNRSETVKMLFR
ncbi:MAG: hypothetical protein M3Q33_13105 [Acidobacteriota bacterium]|nr:hypothetical protein [Acidobacteriota bacterium]